MLYRIARGPTVWVSSATTMLEIDTTTTTIEMKANRRDMSWRRSAGRPCFDPDTELARLTAWLVGGSREISLAMNITRVDYVPMGTMTLP